VAVVFIVFCCQHWYNSSSNLDPLLMSFTVCLWRFAISRSRANSFSFFLETSGYRCQLAETLDTPTPAHSTFTDENDPKSLCYGFRRLTMAQNILISSRKDAFSTSFQLSLILCHSNGRWSFFHPTQPNPSPYWLLHFRVQTLPNPTQHWHKHPTQLTMGVDHGERGP